MSPRRRPDSTRPIRTAAAVASRHAEIIRLWTGGNSALKIAPLVGLKNADTVLRHIDKECRCAV